MRIRPVAAARGVGRYVRRRLQAHALVLMYHRIADSRADPWRLCVSPRNFAEQLQVLERHAPVVPLSQLERHLSGPRRTKSVSAVTFDDGYVDNLHTALPALVAAGAPATVFVATAWIGRDQPFWWDVLAETILGQGRRPMGLEIRLGSEIFTWTAGERGRDEPTDAELLALHRSLWKRLRLLDDTARVEALAHLQAWAGQPVEDRLLGRAMTAAEVVELKGSGLVDVGAHARSHRSLTSLPVEERWREIYGSRQDCERLLGAPPHSLAYPHGHYDGVTAGLVQRAGFELGFAATPGLLWATSDRYRIRRFVATDLDGEAFERKLRTEWLP